MTAETTAIHSSLSEHEQTRLERLEATIDRNFLEMGQALQEIKDARLYRDYGTWEVYCMQRWRKTARRIDQIISGALLASSIRVETQNGVYPESEGQTRALTGLPITDAALVYETAVQAHGEHPTAKQITETRQRMGFAGVSQNGTEPEDPPEPLVSVPDDPVRRAVYASHISLVIQRMNEDVLTPDEALVICDAIAAAHPRVRELVLRLEMYDGTMIRELNRLHKEGRDSFDELSDSTVLQSNTGWMYLKDAKPQDLRDWLDWKRSEHRKHAYADKLLRDRQEALVMDTATGAITLRVPGIEHEVQPGDKVLVTIVRT